jgi:CDP-glucose 4,6-dehydratase
MGKMNFNEFFKGKRVLVTGHTGFKGAWLSIWLNKLGAKVIGYGLDPQYKNSLFELAKLSDKIIDIREDIRDIKTLKSVFEEHKPDIVIHLAAQAIVRLSYDIPRETFETNFMGTINVMECLRKYPIKSAVLITSDKCYKNIEKREGYVETDDMSDQDPYSCSKGCIEMAVQSYRNSFGLKVATTRAGNVVGGGDWAPDRLVPDIIRALDNEEDIIIRSPEAVRPWQFVLEPLFGYLLLAKKIYEGEELNEGWNFGPDRISMVPVKDVVKKMINTWGSGNMIIQEDFSKHEAGLLYLDCVKSKTRLGWKPKVDIDKAISYIVDWYKNYQKEDAYGLCAKQITNYEETV